AALGIPSCDEKDAEVARNLRPTSLGGLKMKSSSSGKPRQAERYRLSNIPVSRNEGESGTALPVTHCDKCGLRPLPSHEAAADSCPECGGPARRAPGTIDPRLTAMWTWLSACAGSDGVEGSSPWNGGSEWRPQTTRVVASPDAAELLFEQRL